jgi:predicted DNA-binding protein with PD1-like motif
MRYTFDGHNYFVRLDKGEQLKPALDQFMQESAVTGAWVQAIGAVTEVNLGFYNLDTKEYRWQTFTGLREITSIQGTIAADETGEMMFHLHGTFSDDTFQVIGGHVKDLTAGGTVEIFVHRTEKPLHRITDPAVGLQVLKV